MSIIDPHTNFKIDEELRQKIVDFAYNQKHFFKVNPMGDGRRMCTLNEIDTPLTHEVNEFAKKVYSMLGIDEYDEEPLFGNFIGFNEENAFVHRHMDPGRGSKWHVRLNFLIQKPESGGLPTINDIAYDVEEGGCWKNIASSWFHGSTPVVGSRERIALSLGALIDESIATKFYDDDSITMLRSVPA
jgi:hypothetical protein